MEPLRRRALIDAAIDVIGEHGSLDVTMSEIAGRAGVSPALAHHYFGAKEVLLSATMRHILSELGRDLRQAIDGLSGLERVRAIIAVNFSEKQFRPEVIAAWLAFYVEAQRTASLRRLLRVYARRLHSNLVFALKSLMPESEAQRTAEGIAALIDGLYIRRALKDGPPDSESAVALVEDYLSLRLGERNNA